MKKLQTLLISFDFCKKPLRIKLENLGFTFITKHTCYAHFSLNSKIDSARDLILKTVKPSDFQFLIGDANMIGERPKSYKIS